MQGAAPPPPLASRLDLNLNQLPALPPVEPLYRPLALNGAGPDEQRRWEKEQHRLDLLRQIQDNEHRKRLEKQKEWELDERERLR